MSEDEEGIGVLCGGSRQRQIGWRQRSFSGEKDLLSHLRGLKSTVGVEAEVQERAAWEIRGGRRIPSLG